jgi:sortase A
MNKRANRVSTALIIIGSLMIAACAALVWWNYHQSSKAKRSADKLQTQVENAIAQHENASSLHPDSSEAPAIEAVRKHMPVVEVDGNDCIGYLTVPAADLKMPVFNTFTYYKLNIAPCRYYGSLETDDLVIAGHNFNSGFEKLKQLKKKDTVLFTNMNGETYSYRVEDTEMLKPEQVTDMVQSSYDLSLYTCNYSGSERFTVRCRITD